jgi:hypothetical protein
MPANPTVKPARTKSSLLKASSRNRPVVSALHQSGKSLTGVCHNLVLLTLLDDEGA